MTEHTPTPWYSVANSWQYTTIYDANEKPICRLDLDDWGVTEDSQDRLEEVQAQAAAFIVKATNNHDALVRRLTSIEHDLRMYAAGLQEGDELRGVLELSAGEAARTLRAVEQHQDTAL